MEEDGFKLVKSSKNNKNSSYKGRNFLQRCHENGLRGWENVKSTINIGAIRIKSIEELTEQVDKCCTELQNEHYLAQLTKSMKVFIRKKLDDEETKGLENVSTECKIFEEIVCFGLGNFSQSITSLYQLALLISMKRQLKYCDNLVVYDPCFTEFEAKALESAPFEIHLLRFNTECSYPLSGDETNQRATLFFMPHMYAVHYDNLLGSNWSHLSRLVLLCNSFQHLLSTEEIREFEYLHKLTTGRYYNVSESKVLNQFHFNDIFNNLSIHTFTKLLK